MRSLPCFVTESLALIFVQNVGFVKVVKVSSSPSTRSSQRRRTTSLPFSTRRRCPRSRPQPRCPAPWGTGSSYPWGKSLGGNSLFPGSLVVVGESMEEFMNSAWRGQRTSEEREPSLWEKGEDHQEGGAQFCSSSTSGLQWEKVKV